jgi:NAD(P) transhydrogenase subunit alpha
MEDLLISHGIYNLIIFVLAIYVGYHVVWNVTPALHTPLMAVTNAISAIVIIGAMLAAALTVTPAGKIMGTLAVALAAVNVFGGFLVTRRMLEMIKKKTKSEGQKKHEYEFDNATLPCRFGVLHPGAERSVSSYNLETGQLVRHDWHGDRHPHDRWTHL